jgi:purine-nucleoside phosphorylase
LSELYKKIHVSARFIRKEAGMKPAFGIILGSGLDALARKIKVSATIPFADIPGFPVSTLGGLHAGNLIIGELSGKKVAAMEGRIHYYEGYSMRDVAFPVWVMKALGVRSLILTSAVGGMNPLMPPGSLVAVTDHINLMGDNPLIGPNDGRIGPRFPDMSEPYDRKYIAVLEKAALDLKIPLSKGVLVAVAGPNLETAAEYRFLRRIGADIVGMSMIPENLAAIHSGMKVLGVSVVTDEALPDRLKPAKIKEIIATANEGGKKLSRLLALFLERVR